ncbi:hypothetical protein B7463_g159, partial [Scytalidium lignicola]
MSFDQLSSIEAQPIASRRQDDSQYSDDPEFSRLSQQLSSKLFTLTGNISRLSNEIALLGTKRDTERVRERVHDLLEESKAGFKEVGEGVKKIQAWEDPNPSQKYTQQKLARELQNNLQEFQSVQRQALEKERSSAAASRAALEEAQATNAEGGSAQVGQQQSQEQLRLASQDEVDFQDSLIVEREAEIRNIEQGVTELNELFRDVAHIISEQGEQIDSIAQNVDNTRTHVRGADLELRSAARYQKNARSKACSTTPLIELFNEISRHVCNLLTTIPSEPASKRRRLDEPLTERLAVNGASQSNGSSLTGPSITILDPAVLLEIKDISIVLPQRKKYTLCFTPTHLYARSPDSKDPVLGISYAWNDLEHIFCLPVPEKAQKQYNYILFPKDSNLPVLKPVPGSQLPPDPLVFTISDIAPKPGSISGADLATASAVSDDYKTLFDWAISTRVRAAHNPVKITEADSSLFASTLRQPQRPSEKAVHVKAFRGSKDGYLFFLPSGILWGFKKPLIFLPHNRIAGVSYTNVLQRTFNLTIEADMSLSSPSTGTAAGVPAATEEREEEIEFAMLDQEDFSAIDEYVKRHGLQDRSMAEQRRAKRLNVNVVKDEDGNVVGNAEAGELERAAMEAGQLKKQKLQGDGAAQLLGTGFNINMDEDEEDEDEEDYDPGSEGESEGEGDESSEDTEEDGEGEGDDEDEDEEEGEE